MKKIISFLVLINLVFLMPVFSADEWLKTQPAGNDQAADIDLLVGKNNAALDRVLANHRRNMTVVPSSVSAVSVQAGEIVCSNSDGSVRKFRQNVIDTSVGWADIDTGTEGASTSYYVYANCDADATTATFKISASASAPSGITSYRLIGYFYNNSSSDIVDVGNLKGGDVSNIISVSASSATTTTSSSYSDVDSMILRFYSCGRPVVISFPSASTINQSGWTGYTRIDIDGATQSGEHKIQNGAGAITASEIPIYKGVLAAGVHTIKGQFKTTGGTMTIDQRDLIAEEL